MPNEVYIVWNEAKTEGFATTDHQLAYEARKGSGGNCYDAEGKLSTVAVAFVEAWCDGNCSIEVVEESMILEDGTDAD